MYKIIICGGGTAGHVYPAISIIEYIQDLKKDVDILYLGSTKGMENDLVPRLGVQFKSIASAGLIPSPSMLKKVISYLRFMVLTVYGFFQAVKIVMKYNPESVLGMGGYVCGPTLLAALLLRKKIFLHEQNFIPGRLNKVFARFSKNIFVSFEESKKYFKVKEEKIIFSGNPVRKIIKGLKERKVDYKKWGLDEKRFTITAFGGSLGAQQINHSVINLYNLYRNDSNIQIVLICGKRFYERFLNILDKNRKKNDTMIFKIYPYINEMDEVYAFSDMIISRSGANTIAELMTTNIPAILVPFPKAINNHQYYNARYLEEKNKAFIVSDSDLNENIIFDTINQLMKDDKKDYYEIKNRTIEDFMINSPEIITEYLIGGIVERN